MGKLDSIAPRPTFGWMVDVMGRYNPCSSFAVFPSRRTATTGCPTNDYIAGHYVNQEASSGVGAAVLVKERSLSRYAQTVTMAAGGPSRSTPKTFTTALVHCHTADGPRILVPRHVEHTSRAIKAPVVVLEETRLTDLKPAECEVRPVTSAATDAPRVASTRETVFCPTSATMKGDV
jgi:hypothetical protein